MNDKTDIEILLVNKTQVVKQLATIEMINSKVIRRRRMSLK